MECLGVIALFFGVQAVAWFFNNSDEMFREIFGGDKPTDKPTDTYSGRYDDREDGTWQHDGEGGE